MFTVYPQIANRLRSKVAALRTIDYDQGQLANPEHAAPMDFPACLISVEKAKWSGIRQNKQRGALILAVTVAIRPTIMHTGQTSPELYLYPAMMQPVTDVFTALSGYKGGEKITGINNEEEVVEIEGTPFTGLTRTDTQRMKRYDEIQAYTHLFSFELTDSSAEKAYVKNPAPPEIRAYTPNSVAVFPEELG